MLAGVRVRAHVRARYASMNLQREEQSGQDAGHRNAFGAQRDTGHVPARRSYEKAGYRALPTVRYTKDLS